jgi:hypothetical protein
VGISRGRLSEIVNNTNFGEINTLLSRGRDMDYIASHYHMDLALACQTYGGQAQRPNMSLSPYLKSLPAIASRSGEAGGEEHNVPSIRRVLKE